MADSIHRATARQVLAGIIAAPEAHAARARASLQSDDFEDWRDREVFDALAHVVFPADHPEPHSIILQVNKKLMDAGKYTDQDNGLRAFVIDLMQIEGHPEQLPVFTAQLIEHRYRRQIKEYGTSVIGHADTSPLEDTDAALAQINALREQRRRLSNTASGNVYNINERKLA